VNEWAETQPAVHWLHDSALDNRHRPALGVVLAPERGLDSIGQSGRENVRPLSDSGGADPDGFGGGGDRPAEQFDGFLFLHALMLAGLPALRKRANR
jgi:hypothetical protein